MSKPDEIDQKWLDMSLRDALKCVRRLSKCCDSEAYSAALAFVRVLRKCGAKDE